ncbi:MAG: acyl-CoA dehydrogenase family protein [Betaproteobacteria bacterium]|nr:acyl-CoA dehydrogenase family protein [Desulfovibrionaceae bacterium]MCL1985544.1 acyl-CoA dehydrogenase family protein [Betaproteobacteria bacterium]
MNFSPSEEQVLIRNMVREFADNEIKPIAAEIDKTHRFPEETVARMKDLSLFGLALPEEYGGTGVDSLAAAIVYEELARVDASHSIILSVHGMATKPIYYFGTDEQKQKYLPDLASGKSIGCFCLTEPGAGTDAGAQASRGVREGDKFIINGSKVFITNGSVGGTYVIFVMTQPDKGLKGITAFIVDRDNPGLKIGQLEEKMGICASATAEVIFDNMVVPVSDMLGQEGDGFKIAMRALDAGRIGVAAQAVGIAQGAMEAAVTYIKDRKQFGKPIAANQGIQWMVADMANAIEGARLLTYQAAWYNDTPGRWSKYSAMAKLTAARMAMDVTRDAIQLHGGIGYTRNYPVERFLRDAKITEIYEGTNEVMKMVISGAVLA